MNFFQKIVDFLFGPKPPTKVGIKSGVTKTAPEKIFTEQKTPKAPEKKLSEQKPLIEEQVEPSTSPPEQKSSKTSKTFAIPASQVLARLQEPDTKEQIRQHLTAIGARPTADQWNMILESSPSTRVVAGAGSGKSTTLILRLLVLHKVLGVPLSKMKVFSFTRASVHEFQMKLAEKLELWEIKIEGRQISKAEQERLQADAKAVVSTFHSVIARLRKVVMPEISNSNFFDLLGSSSTEEENEAVNPLLSTKLSDEQLKVLVIAHENAFLGSERYRQILKRILEEQQRREWQKTNDKALKSENEVYFWNCFLAQEKEYHGYRGGAFSPSPLYCDKTGSAHVDPYRVAVANRLRELGFNFAPLVPFAIRPPRSGWPEGTLHAAFVIGRVYLHVDRKIDYRTNKAMFFQQRDRRKFIALYCPTVDQHKLLTQRDFQKQDDDLVLTPDADMRLQQWIGLQDWAASPTTAPAIRVQLPGDVQQRHIAELLYQEGNFVESVGLEVADLTLEGLVPTDQLTGLVAELLKLYWPYFDEVLHQRQLVRFHDILTRLRQPEYLEKVLNRTEFLQNLFIDEFQDISPEIVDWLRKTLQAHSPNSDTSVIGIGDDFQSIYGWRGSSPTFLMDYHRHFPAHRVGSVTMSDNFRSRQSIIDAAEVVLEGITQKINKHGVSPIASLETVLPYSVLMSKSTGWELAGDDEMPSDETSAGDNTIWTIFSEHVVRILTAIHNQGFFEKLFRERKQLEIFILSRSNAGLGRVPPKKVLQQALVQALRLARLDWFADVSLQNLTFHRSKGLEADFVLLVEDALPPEAHPLRDFVYSQAGFVDTYTKTQEEEARRLAYVAVTRARYGVMWVANTDLSSKDFKLSEQGCFAKIESHVKAREST